MAQWTQELPYFSDSELRCRHCHVLKLDLVFAALLVALRVAWGEALTPTSVCRCAEHNKAIGGHPTSMHLVENPKHPTDGCAAVDVFWRLWNANQQLRFARLAYKMGFSVGLHVGFVHLDVRSAAHIGLPKTIYTYSVWDNRFTVEEVKDYERLENTDS